MSLTRSTAPAAIQCPTCDDVIALSIPVIVTIEDREDGQHLTAWVDGSSLDTQPVWDHALTAHGPKLDGP